MKYIIFAIFSLGILLPSISSHRMPFYRTDYTYFESFDAFYKIHSDDSATSWTIAFNTCADEGATLFYPKAEREWTLVKNLTDSATDVLNVTEIFVGFHDDYKLGEFITVDGYKYMNASRKCYKVNKKLKLWKEAMKTCFIEGGILAVIENKAQAEEVKDIIEPEVSYFVGVRKIVPQHSAYNSFKSTYYTVKGKKLSEMYQNQGPPEQDLDYGTVRKQHIYLYTNTASDMERLPFICEMEAV